MISSHEHDGVLSSNIEYLENTKGAVQVAFCTYCGIPNSVICEHQINTWKGKEGSRKLTCDLCGSDGT